MARRRAAVQTGPPAALANTAGPDQAQSWDDGAVVVDEDAEDIQPGRVLEERDTVGKKTKFNRNVSSGNIAHMTRRVLANWYIIFFFFSLPKRRSKSLKMLTGSCFMLCSSGTSAGSTMDDSPVNAGSMGMSSLVVGLMDEVAYS